MTVPYQPRNGRSDGEGADMFSTTVMSSGASIDATDAKNTLAGADAKRRGQRALHIALRAGLDVETVLELRIHAPVPPATESTFTVHRVGGVASEIRIGSERSSAEEFFEQNPPLVRLADGSGPAAARETACFRVWATAMGFSWSSSG